MPVVPLIPVFAPAAAWPPEQAGTNCCDLDQLAAFSAVPRGSSVGSSNAQLQSMDARLLLVLTPILLAAGWAAFNIGRAAIGQLQLMLKRANG